MTDIDKTFHSSCKANGCPLAATVVTHWYEPEKKRDPRLPRWGVCEYHSEAPGREWTATTRKIIANIKTIRLHQAMRSIADSRIKPIPGEQVSVWLDRCARVIDDAVLPNVAPVAVIPDDAFAALRNHLSAPGEH